MKKHTETLNVIGSNSLSIKDREDLDFYQTPQYAVDTLLKNHLFPENIWEPMAGNGAISKILMKHGFNVYSTDIIERNFKLNAVVDYFKDGIEYAKTLPEEFSIITNPPYVYAFDFLRYTLEEIKPLHCCLFLPIRYLEGQKRYDGIYSKYRPSRILVYSKRLGCYTEEDVQNGKVNELGVGSAVAYMWLCFDRETMYDKDRNTELIWIN